MDRKMNCAFGLIAVAAVLGMGTTAGAALTINFETSPATVGSTYGGFPTATTPQPIVQSSGVTSTNIPVLVNGPSGKTDGPTVESTVAIDGSQSMQYGGTDYTVNLNLTEDRSDNPFEVLGSDTISQFKLKLGSSTSSFKWILDANNGSATAVTDLEFGSYGYYYEGLTPSESADPGFYVPGDILLVTEELNFNTDQSSLSIFDETQNEVFASYSGVSFANTVTIPAGATSLSRVLNVGSSNVYLDDIVFENASEAPEPASWSLLGLGALGLIRRKRCSVRI